MTCWDEGTNCKLNVRDRRSRTFSLIGMQTEHCGVTVALQFRHPAPTLPLNRFMRTRRAYTPASTGCNSPILIFTSNPILKLTRENGRLSF
jgi:hypothetical protein